jgi:tetrathionate reductase subunit B
MDRRSLLEMFSFGKKAEEPTPRPVRYAMAIDMRRCVGCQACTVACAMENRTPLGAQRTSVGDFEVMEDARPRKVLAPRLCNHCRKPSCVPACPVGATFQRQDGLVLVDPAKCVGCGYCVLNCPYAARFLNHQAKLADKCTLCAHRLDAGLLPACVETCIGKARIVGDLSDPDSAVAKLLAAAGQSARVFKPEAGTEPQVFYVGLSAAEELPRDLPGVPGHVRVTEENFR